jgi:hypothetical protein
MTSDEAQPANGQHKAPCGDCPWRRDALRGWLGSLSVEEWLREAHGEARIECHTLTGAQCAGAAIYRGNVCKKPRDPNILKLPAAHVRVFSSPAEFTSHHNKKGT